MKKELMLGFLFLIVLSSICFAENVSENASKDDIIGTWDIYAELTKGNSIYFVIVVLAVFIVFLKLVDIASSSLIGIASIILTILVIVAILRLIF